MDYLRGQGVDPYPGRVGHLLNRHHIHLNKACMDYPRRLGIAPLTATVVHLLMQMFFKSN